MNETQLVCELQERVKALEAERAALLDEVYELKKHAAQMRKSLRSIKVRADGLYESTGAISKSALGAILNDAERGLGHSKTQEA